MSHCVWVGSNLRLAVVGFVLLTLSYVNARATCSSYGNEQYTTLNGAENGGQALRAVGPDMANAVLTPACPAALIGVELEVKLQRRDLGSFDVFYSLINNAGKPYEVHVFATVSDQKLTRNFKRIFVQPQNTVGLHPNRRYYVGIRKHVGALSTVILGNTVDPAVLARRDVINGAYFYDHLAQEPNSKGPFEMHVILE